VGRNSVQKIKANELMYAHAYLQCLQCAALQPLESFAAKFLDGGQKYISGVRRLNVLLEDTVRLIRKLLIPEEPLAVICHGNINMRNIFYRYDANNKPFAVKFLEFQDVHCVSSATDLTVFLFLSASPEPQAESLGDLVSIYHQSLLKTMAGFLDCPEEDLLPEYGVDAFKDEFSRHAVYGYILTAAYVTSAVPTPVKIGKVFEMYDDGVPSREDIDECIRNNLKLEGEEVTYRLACLIKELVDKGYL
jgi:hypothetical protein